MPGHPASAQEYWRPSRSSTPFANLNGSLQNEKMKLTRLQFLACVAPIAVFGQSKALSVEEVEEALKNKKVFLLDVREPKELTEEGAIEGYTNIPITQLEQRLDEIPKDKIVLTLCRRGTRATKAAGVLEKNGYKVIGSCGIEAWKKENKPVIYPK